MTARRLPLYLSLLLLTQCSKCKDDVAPLDQLPPATQTGANTFGCLVNGQAWTPKGYNGFSNYSVSYDQNPMGGVLDIHTYRIYGNATSETQNLVLFITQISGVGRYSLRNNQQTRASFHDVKSSCYWSSRDNATTYYDGKLTITRLDLQAGVISGTFEFTLAKHGCDTIRITQGRFDKKL